MESSFRVNYYNPHVREEIEAWPVDLLARCDELLDLLEDHGLQLRAPHSEALGDGLFELRPKSRSGIGRAFCCHCRGRVITILHAFFKKTQKTPKRELAIVRQRLKEVKRHG
ncbi:MAG: type II toxin-antitoxin system RelE/ParE family toxin [Cyanobacteriota bacterium]|jgi:phage-related protein